MTSDATTVLQEAKCGRCGADMLMSITMTIDDDGTTDDDGRDIVNGIFHKLELVTGCEHAERVRDTCTIRLAVDPL